jgi:2-methylisocitrate lyase-like PEP mutase family enzyme
MLFVEAPQAEADLARIGAECPGPQICNLVIGGKTPILPRERLQEMGFAGIIYANAPLQAAVKAMRDVLTALHESGSAAGLEHMVASFRERQAMVQHDFYKELEARYAFVD